MNPNEAQIYSIGGGGFLIFCFTHTLTYFILMGHKEEKEGRTALSRLRALAKSDKLTYVASPRQHFSPTGVFVLFIVLISQTVCPFAPELFALVMMDSQWRASSLSSSFGVISGCLCASVVSSVFVVALMDAYALRKRQFASSLKPELKPAFFAPFLSIIHHRRHWMLVIKALLLEGSI